MSEQEALIAIWRQATATHTALWVSYIAVLFPVMAFCFTDTYARAPRVARTCLLIAFLAFVSVNGWSIWDNLGVYNAAATQLVASGSAGERLEPVARSIREIHAGHLTAVHVVLDACAVALAVRRS